MSILVVIHRVDHDKVILVAILSRANLEEVETIINYINEITTPWFAPYFEFLINIVLPKKIQILINNLESMTVHDLSIKTI